MVIGINNNFKNQPSIFNSRREYHISPKPLQTAGKTDRLGWGGKGVISAQQALCVKAPFMRNKDLKGLDNGR